MSIKHKPKLYVHFKNATHFLAWEIPYWASYFQLVDSPSKNAILLCFGPDALEEASNLPASTRFAVLFPGFGYNPLYNIEIRKSQKAIIQKKFRAIFINPGPLEIAYKDFPNVNFYPFSVDTNLVRPKKYRTKLDSLLHVSNDGLQKDWQRSKRIMELTGLRHEVYPPRDENILRTHIRRNEYRNKARRLVGLNEKKYLPLGYVNHKLVVKKYQHYDGFVHVAKDVKHPQLIDGKYTASLIEAGITGALLFWHDTLDLGNNLETVFDLPLNEQEAAAKIMDIRSSINIEKHSKLTSEEMLDTFNPESSVKIRAEIILKSI